MGFGVPILKHFRVLFITWPMKRLKIVVILKDRIHFSGSTFFTSGLATVEEGRKKTVARPEK